MIYSRQASSCTKMFKTNAHTAYAAVTHSIGWTLEASRTVITELADSYPSRQVEVALISLLLVKTL